VCEEDQFAVAGEGKIIFSGKKLTNLVEAQPKPKMNLSERSVKK
jgi:hypothetical protein